MSTLQYFSTQGGGGGGGGGGILEYICNIFAKSFGTQISTCLQCERIAMTSQWVKGWTRHILRRHFHHPPQSCLKVLLQMFYNGAPYNLEKYVINNLHCISGYRGTVRSKYAKITPKNGDLASCRIQSVLKSNMNASEENIHLMKHECIYALWHIYLTCLLYSSDGTCTNSCSAW